MDAAEEYVRSRWADCGSSEPINRHERWQVWVSDGQRYFEADTESFAWQAAYEFTLAREKKIRQVSEEIALIQNVEKTTAAFIASIYVAKHIKQDADKEHPVWQRILKARQAHLDSLLVGWKGK